MAEADHVVVVVEEAVDVEEVDMVAEEEEEEDEVEVVEDEVDMTGKKQFDLHHSSISVFFHPRQYATMFAKIIVNVRAQLFRAHFLYD